MLEARVAGILYYNQFIFQHMKLMCEAGSRVGALKRGGLKPFTNYGLVCLSKRKTTNGMSVPHFPGPRLSPFSREGVSTQILNM